MGQHEKGPSGNARLLYWLCLALAMIFPAVTTSIYFVFLAAPPGTAPGYSALTVYAISKLIEVGLPVTCVWIFARQRLHLPVLNLSGLRLGLAFGLLAGAAILLTYYGLLRGTSYLASMPASVRAKLEAYHATTPFRYLVLALFIAGAHSLLEEYYWRWFVFGELRRELRLLPAILASSLAFMLHHVIVLAVYMPGRFWTGVMPMSLAVALGGAVWAWLYDRTGSIYACWLSHLITDAAIMMLGFDLVFVYGS